MTNLVNVVDGESLRRHNPMMPGDLQKLMTEPELVDLVEYLKSLKSKAIAVR